MKTSINVYPENQYTELNLTVQVPFCNDLTSRKGLSEEERKAINYDLLGTFSKRLISSLERRMKACQENLLRHLDDVVYSDECGIIVYKRKDGTLGKFHTFSFKAMQDAVKALQHSCWKDFLSNKFWVDQTLKALLNDTVQDHSDEGGMKYSNLVSLLCEIHMMY